MLALIMTVKQVNAELHSPSINTCNSIFHQSSIRLSVFITCRADFAVSWPSTSSVSDNSGLSRHSCITGSFNSFWITSCREKHRLKITTTKALCV